MEDFVFRAWCLLAVFALAVMLVASYALGHVEANGFQTCTTTTTTTQVGAQTPTIETKKVCQ